MTNGAKIRIIKGMDDIIYLKCADSTNDVLKAVASERAEWTVVIAEKQTKGKGSKEREFVSPTGGLYMSVLFFPSEMDLGLVTPMAAVAVKRAIKEKFNLETGIKWVNDLYLNGKKICGILTECKTTDKGVTAIIGIGINVYRSESGYGEYEDKAGCLCEGTIDKSMLIGLAQSVVEQLKNFKKNGGFLHEYAAASILSGKSALLSINGVEKEVFIEGIASDGGLIAVSADGTRETIIDGEVLSWKA